MLLADQIKGRSGGAPKGLLIQPLLPTMRCFVSALLFKMIQVTALEAWLPWEPRQEHLAGVTLRLDAQVPAPAHIFASHCPRYDQNSGLSFPERAIAFTLVHSSSSRPKLHTVLR